MFIKYFRHDESDCVFHVSFSSTEELDTYLENNIDVVLIDKKEYEQYIQLGWAHD